MPVNLLPRLPLLNPSLSATNFPVMKLGPSIQPSRVIPLLSRVFPFKLKYVGVGFASRTLQNDLGVRRFATRPFKIRNSSGSRSAAGRIGEGGSVRASKSLIDDEAELSDWVSDLRTSSFRGRITSDEETGEDRRRSRGSYSDRNSLPVKRGRDRGLNELRDSDRGRARGPMESYSKSSRNGNRRFKGGFKDEDDGNDEEDYRPRSSGRARGPMESNSKSSRNDRRFDDEKDYRPRSNGRARGPMESYTKSSRNGGRFKGELKDSDEEDNRPRSNGSVFRRENVNSSMGRGRAREINSGNQWKGGRESLRRGGRDSEKRVHFLGQSGEEEEDDDDEVGQKTLGGIEDFLSDEDSAEDDDNKLLERSADSLFPSGEEASERDPARNSPGNSSSYLSETR